MGLSTTPFPLDQSPSKCRLLALSGHGNRLGECPLAEAKRTSPIRSLMSANDPKRTSVALTKTFNRRRLPLVAANDDRPPRRHSECTESDLSTFRLHVSFR